MRAELQADAEAGGYGAAPSGGAQGVGGALEAGTSVGPHGEGGALDGGLLGSSAKRRRLDHGHHGGFARDTENREEDVFENRCHDRE